MFERLKGYAAPIAGLSASPLTWFLANYDRALSALLSVASLAFLAWQWRRQVRKDRRERKGPR